MDVLAALRVRGAEGAITVHDSEYAFAEPNPIMERLDAALVSARQP